MDHHQHTANRASLAAPERARADPAGLATLRSVAAAAAGLSPPRKDEAPGWQAQGFRDHGRANCPDCAQHRAGAQSGAYDCKRFATLRARLALSSWGLIRTDPSDGALVYFATRWNMPRELSDLAAVEAFADRVGAPR